MDTKKIDRKETFKKASKKRRDSLEVNGYKTINTHVKQTTKEVLENIKNIKGFNKVGEVIDFIIEDRSEL